MGANRSIQRTAQPTPDAAGSRQTVDLLSCVGGLDRSAKSDGSALWGLLGISFAYGIFHAAGPGHGKAVISSYLFTNEETWRRGITLSFASVVMQSLTAVAIVSIAAILLGATAKLMGDTVRVVEVVSYGLITLLGARLMWINGRGFLNALRELRTGDKIVALFREHDHKQRRLPSTRPCA